MTAADRKTELDESDRREHRRLAPSELPHSTLIRIANRPPISVIDFSAGGALLNMPFPLRPEKNISLQLVTPREQLAVPFRLLRCYVSDLSRGVRYRAAIQFDDTIKLPEAFPDGSRLDGPLSTIEALLRATRGVDVSSRGVCFSVLVSRVVEGLRKGESAGFLLGQIRSELVRLFPRLTIVRASTLPLFDPLTSARFFGIEFRADRDLTTEDRRFLRAGAQLMTLVDKNIDNLVQHVPPPMIVHTIAQWQALSR